MRRLTTALALVLALAACSEVAGVTANATLKGHQTANAGAAEDALARRFAADPALSGLKASVAIANHWRDGFQTRTSVLLAGTAPDAATQARAAALIKDILGDDPDAIAILDLSRIEPR